MTEEDWQGPRPGRIDLKEAGINQREACLTICDDAQIWRTPDGTTYATVIVENHQEHHAVRSRQFRDWLLSEVAAHYALNGRPASVTENVVRDTRQALEARAFTDRITYAAPLRVVAHDDSILIDTGWPDWEAFQVSPDGWEIIPCSPVPIVRSKRTGAMAMPAERRDFSDLRMLLRDMGEAEYVLLLSWCLMALWPAGPYPIGLLSGEQGSGKSTKARLVQALVDPVNGDLLQPPTNDRDLIAAARQSRVLAFDNMSGLKPDLADSLCRLSTGAEIGGRALFTDWDSASFAACQPVFCNGIPDLASRGDLADRAIRIRLGPIQTRMSEKEFWRRAEEAMPGALAGLLDALVLGLREFERTPTPNVRMADFAKLIIAAEPQLPWRKGAFLEAYNENRKTMSAGIVESDEVAGRVLTFAEKNGDWSGLVSELFRLLSDGMSAEQCRATDWPTNKNWFGNCLTRTAPALRAMGIDVSSKHGRRGTTVTLTRMLSPSSRSPDTGQAIAKSDIGGDNFGLRTAVSSQEKEMLSRAITGSPAAALNSDNGDDISAKQWLSADDFAFIDGWARQ